MKVAAYNTEKGGFESYHDYETPCPPRLEKIQEAIATIGADAIGISDTFRWHDVFTTADLRKIFGYDHAVTQPISDLGMGKVGRNIGITVLSNREIIQPTCLPIGSRDALAMHIDTGNGEPTQMLAAYFHHASERQRLEHASALTQHAFNGSGEITNTIAVGDFNNQPPEGASTWLLRQVLRLMTEDGQESTAAQIGNMLRGSAYEHLVNAGFEDANRHAIPTAPTRFFKLAGRIVVPTLLRPDHILHTPDLETDGPAFVLRQEIFDQASDHYPVAVELK